MIDSYLKDHVAAMNRWLEQEGEGKEVSLVIGSGRWHNIAAADTQVSHEASWGCFFVNTIEEEYNDGIITASLDIRFTLSAAFSEGIGADFDICRDAVYRLYHGGRKYVADSSRIAVENIRSVPFVNYTGDNLAGVRFRCTARNITPNYIECRI